MAFFSWIDDDTGMQNPTPLFLALLLTGLLVTVATYLYLSAHAINALLLGGRLSLETLNPISVGHLGGSLLLLSSWLLFIARRSVSFRLKCLSLFGLGLLPAARAVVVKNMRTVKMIVERIHNGDMVASYQVRIGSRTADRCTFTLSCHKTGHNIVTRRPHQ